MSPAPVHLVRGDDESLVRDAVMRLVDDLVGDEDRTLAVEDLDTDDYPIAALVDAAQTPPFLTAKRVVIGRGVHRFAKSEDVTPIVGYLAAPLATTALVLVWTAGKVPKSLLDAVKASGGVQLDASSGRDNRSQQAWLQGRLAHAAVKLDAAAVSALADVIGEDKGRVGGILATLESAFGAGARLSAADVTPYLGEAGGVPPWELTDPIDRGDITAALDRLHRMLGGGERHALAVLATLHGHYSMMLALDGADVAGEKDAAELLGIKSAFRARKALEQTRRLGSNRVASAIGLLARSDRDLRGERKWPDALVLEVLVARLANLSAATR
ncbi:MAG: DNA polymerase III subunit delta [Acidimicrobiales bacterium]